MTGSIERCGKYHLLADDEKDWPRKLLMGLGTPTGKTKEKEKTVLFVQGKAVSL